MAYDVIMPQMGESIAEGTITTWLKKKGDQIERDEPLLEISTDKVDAEIPAPESGILLEIKFPEGSVVEVGALIAVIGEAGEESISDEISESDDFTFEVLPEDESVVHEGAQLVESAPEDMPKDKLEERRLTKSSPVVRNIAAAHGVDISAVEGTGVSGRVTKKDILKYVETQPTKAESKSSPVSAPTSETKLSESKPSATASVAVSKEIPKLYQPRVMQGDTVEKMSTMRSKIAEHMVISKQVSPHVATVWDLDFSRVDMLRKKYKESWKERHGVNLTYTSFIIKAVVDALKEFPVVNASVVGDEIIYHREINLGLAVALDWGLIVPVIKGAGELNLLGLTRRAADLAERARVKKLMPEEVQDGTFSITNPGIFGSLFGLPVINQPQSAIMAVGTIEKRPVVVTHGDDDMIAIRHKSYFALSFDHRLIDGAVADQFMKKVVTGIETFDEKEF